VVDRCSSESFSSLLLSKNVNTEVFKTIILLALYGCETWLLTLRKEQRLRVLENRVLREIFGVKMDKVMRDWIKLRNVKFHNLFPSPNIIRMIISGRIKWEDM
jgi:hypothetical protein